MQIQHLRRSLLPVLQIQDLPQGGDVKVVSTCTISGTSDDQVYFIYTDLATGEKYVKIVDDREPTVSLIIHPRYIFGSVEKGFVYIDSVTGEIGTMTN